jgi:glycosyltransferase involved in cell wall biosynthesis
MWSRRRRSGVERDLNGCTGSEESRAAYGDDTCSVTCGFFSSPRGDAVPERTSADVIVISQLPPPVHGSTIMTGTFIDACAEMGLTTALVDRRFSTSVEEIGGTSARKLLSAVSLTARLWRAVGRHRSASIVFFTTNRAPSFWMDVIMSLLLRAKRRGYIAYVHTSGYSQLAESGGLHERGVRLMLGGASSVVVLGESMRNDVTRFNASVQVIPNTVTGAEGTAVKTSDCAQMTFVSNLIPGKGAEDFMRIADRCLAAAPMAHAVVVGRSSTPHYTDELQSMLTPEVRSRVRFAGPLYDGDRDRVVAASSVLVFPSTYQFEAQPLTLLESLRLAVPVIAYDVGGVGDVVEDGANGYLVGKSDWTAASDRCLEILRSQELQRELSAGARRSFDARFGMEDYRNAWQSVLTGRD